VPATDKHKANFFLSQTLLFYDAISPKFHVPLLRLWLSESPSKQRFDLFLFNGDSVDALPRTLYFKI